MMRILIPIITIFNELSMALELRKITSIDNDPGFKSEVELRNTPELLDTPESYTDMMQYGLLNFPNIAKGFETKPGYGTLS